LQAHSGNEVEAGKFTTHLDRLEKVLELLAVQEKLSPRQPPALEKDLFQETLVLTTQLLQRQTAFLARYEKFLRLVLEKLESEKAA